MCLPGNGFGEIYGSRLGPEVGELLRSRGVSWLIPEINDVVGNSAENVLLLRGVHLPEYRNVEFFDMVTGNPLEIELNADLKPTAARYLDAARAETLPTAS